MLIFNRTNGDASFTIGAYGSFNVVLSTLIGISIWLIHAVFMFLRYFKLSTHD